MLAYTTSKGKQHPLGASVTTAGVNFSLFSRAANSVELLLFEKHDSVEPLQIITLDPSENRTFFFWHIFVEGLKPGMHYAYRVDGPQDPDQGLRFNPRKVLLDPYGNGATDDLFVRADACGDKDNLATSMRNVVIDLDAYDWEGDQPLNRPMNETIIYEMHTGGFTRSPSAKVKNPGTYQAIIEKIPYLKSLGITAVELLPVMHFDETTPLRTNDDGTELTNYWGYSTISFFAPHPGYCVSPQEGCHINEFRDMVKALHKAGIEVILDVVFNHTDEGNHQGPTLNFKGIDNPTYYDLNPEQKRFYMDYTGCGNTFDCNMPVVEKLVVESLEFWVKEMHVDGFRFDEASVLSRDMNGQPMEYPPVLWQIELSEVLADTKVIAEAWDAAGLYQVGHFPGYRWADWNGRYRDDMRCFVRGDAGLVGAVANRLSGSADLYQGSGRKPVNSINFINCHDGFTLNDLVSYNQKHNLANGEGNNDGNNDNMSWNCGVEGPCDDDAIKALRLQQMKNFATLLMISRGVPMFLAGDEICRTQQGNNNAYCQNNALNWFDWQLTEQNHAMLRFFRQLIEFRKSHPTLYANAFFDNKVNSRGLADVSWHGVELNQPGWDDPNARALSYTLAGRGEEADLHIMLNMYWENERFELPQVTGRKWYLALNTANPSPDDFYEEKQRPEVREGRFDVSGRSIAILVSK
ncbi:glycogen debranching protein GlgX [Vibrio navarrensis]|uniref:glycogen debranching protein GlgX n=1 Tax=Vibrio navarrensis TaxID=29495 RepID=UPI001302320F|nr:glycogen debranching protein GlgX [Vibrio navarrensis]